MLGDMGQRPIDTSTPNTRYKSQNLGTWSSIEDVDNFLYSCCHDTGYYGATIGSYVTINDGTYNKQWIIAGFDCEHNRIASDESIYDNGYGICLIPKTSLGNYVWDNNDTSNGYKGSEINTSTLPTVANNLKKVLGDHLIERNVLLSSAKDSSNHYASAYTWTTAHCTLMSMGQITGTFNSNRNKYDDGEANYKLPIFNFTEYKTGSNFWSRGVWGRYGDGYYSAWYVYGDGSIDYNYVGNTYGVRPLIYLR